MLGNFLVEDGNTAVWDMSATEPWSTVLRSAVDDVTLHYVSDLALGSGVRV
jgi:hypothetical protein